MRKALLSKKRYSAALNDLGLALHDQNHYADAIQCWSTIVTLDPQNSDAWSSLGITLRRLDQPEEATAALRKCLALDPKNSVAANNLIGCLESTSLHLADDSYRDNLQLCLERDDIDPGRLHHLVSAYLMMDRRWQDFSRHNYF